MKLEFPFSDTDPFKAKLEGKLVSLGIFFQLVFSSGKGQVAKAHDSQPEADQNAVIRSMKLPFIEYLLCTGHCAKNFLNLIFIVNIISVYIV